MDCTGLNDNAIFSSSDFGNRNPSACPCNKEAVMVRPVALQESVEKQVFKTTEIVLKNFGDMLIGTSWEWNHLDTDKRANEIRSKLKPEEGQTGCLDEDGQDDAPDFTSDFTSDGTSDETSDVASHDDGPVEIDGDGLVSSANNFLNKAKK